MKIPFWDRSFVFPVFLIMICILAYGIIAPSLGFHWDDWPAVWLYEVHGREGLREFFATNRPLLGIFYSITLSLFGPNPLYWHLFALLTRFGVGLAVWWVLGLLWPSRQVEAKWVAAFAVVFPGFTQQSIAVIYSHLMLALIFYLLSVGLMLRASDDHRRFTLLFGLSLFFSALNLLATEYFFGLELLRPVFIWLYTSGKDEMKEKLSSVLKRWWPYALLVAVYLAWRIPFQARFAQAETKMLTAILADPLPNLALLLQNVWNALLVTGLDAWIHPFKTLQLLTNTQWGNIQIVLMVVCVVLTLLYFLVRRSILSECQDVERDWYKGPLALSLSALLLAGIPFAIAELPVKVTFPHDRFMLAFILGSCLFLITFSTWVFKPVARQMFLALLLAVSVGYQVQVGLSFKQEWEDVNAFLWQLSWRVPGLEPGTTLIADETLFPYTNDYSLTAPLNWLYDQGLGSGDLDYFMAYVPHRLGQVIPALQPDQRIRKKYSLYQFTGSTSNVLAVIYEPPACLRILDPRFDRYDHSLTPSLYDAMWLSNPMDLIHSDRSLQKHGVMDLITTEQITDKWCHTYQKADLARQQGDWREVVRLAEIAPTLKGSYKSPTELLPFIEGYARLGEFQKAADLTRTAYRTSGFTQSLLCDLWVRVGPDSQGVYEEVNQMLKCW